MLDGSEGLVVISRTRRDWLVLAGLRNGEWVDITSTWTNRLRGGTLLMAAAVVSMLPVLLLFLVAQKYFIQGIAFTGLKG